MRSNGSMRLVFAEPYQTAGSTRLDLGADGVGTWEINPRTGQHVLSARSRQLLGIRAGEPISIQRLLAALHPGDRERWKEAVAAVLDPEGSGECSLQFRTADPMPRWLTVSGRASFAGMRAVRAFGTLREITEQKGGRS